MKKSVLPSKKSADEISRLILRNRSLVGWREICSLPDLGLKDIKCKVDTGAKTSALHAFDVDVHTENGIEVVFFKVHPEQRSTKRVVQCKCPLLEWRVVTDSGGNQTLRPVVSVRLQLGEVTKNIELTLTPRDELGFRMLLGREALKRTWVVDSSRSYLSIRVKKKSPKKSQNNQ